MKFKTVIAIFAFVFISGFAFGQENWNHIDTHDIISSDTLKKGEFTLIFINKEVSFDPEVKQRLSDAFFEVYPKEVKLYNKQSTRNVIFVIDPAYKGVAAAGGGIVRFNPEWFKKNPEDIDVVTHEVMHLVQSYPDGAGPGWITEGIADYVRYTMGINNEGANWRLPAYNSKQSYENSYRITARFFYWIEKNVDKELVKKLDHAMRTKTYSDSFWSKNTGKSLSQLWDDYGKNPYFS